MCKIAVIPKITSKTQKNAWKFASAITPLLSRGNDDGFGYMGYGRAGIFGERWLNNSDAFKRRYIPTTEEQIIIDNYKNTVTPEVSYNSFGVVDQESVTCLALHARMSTNTIGLQNTHPFVSNNTAIIHNGVISNADPKDMHTSSCDSEVILTSYNALDVTHEIENIEYVMNGLEGYYAVAAITIDNDNRAYLDIFKCERAKLSAVYVKKLDSLVFCTDPDTVIGACKTLGWKVGAIFRVQDYTLLRHDAITGELLVSYESPYPIDAPYEKSYISNYGEVVESMTYEPYNIPARGLK